MFPFLMMIKAKIFMRSIKKNIDEYKIVGVWHYSNSKLSEYSQKIYDELKEQGMNDSGALFIALEIKNKDEFDKMMII